MKRYPVILLLALASTAPARAIDDGKDLQAYQEEQASKGSAPDRAAQPPARPPKLDARRIINESNAFLKEREPEMTEEEAAVYEKVSMMLATNVDLAVSVLKGMLGDKERPSPAFDFILGNAYYAANQLDQAEAQYRGAIDRFPSFLRAWNNLGVAYYSQDRYAEASACFSKAVSLGSRDPVTFNLLGYSLEKQGDFVSAEMAYLQALGGDPGNLDCKEGLLRIYVAGKQYGRAEPLARFLVKARPLDERGWLDYADIVLAQGRKVDAMVVLEEAGDARVAGPDEWELLGDLYAEQNLAPEAVGAYQKLLAAAPQRGERKLLQLAGVLIQAGRLDQARRTLEAASNGLTPAARIDWLRMRADLLIAQKRWPDARREINALLAIQPLDGPGLLSLGRTYLEEGDLPRASLAFEAANRVPESAYEASVELANIEIQNRHFAAAAGYLERALGIQKTDVIEDALARVRALAPPDAASQ